MEQQCQENYRVLAGPGGQSSGCQQASLRSCQLITSFQQMDRDAGIKLCVDGGARARPHRARTVSVSPLCGRGSCLIVSWTHRGSEPNITADVSNCICVCYVTAVDSCVAKSYDQSVVTADAFKHSLKTYKNTESHVGYSDVQSGEAVPHLSS